MCLNLTKLHYSELLYMRNRCEVQIEECEDEPNTRAVIMIKKDWRAICGEIQRRRATEA